MPRQQKIIIYCIIASIAMFAFTFALVPLYNVFCKVTGLNGKIELTTSRYRIPDSIAQRTVIVELDSSVEPNAALEFKPYHPILTVIPGQLANTSFLVKNLTNQKLIVQAIPSISPGRYAQYLKKLECFCFEQQILPPYAEISMPLRFWLEPELPEQAKRITLSYTIFDITKRMKGEPG